MRKFTGFERGINLGGWLSQCNHTKERYDTFITEKDLKEIAVWGMDHVRVPVDYELVQNEDGSFKEGGFVYIDQCMEWCRENHLNMVIDLHKAKGYSFDKGEKEQGFFDSEKLQDQFIDLWKEFAIRYGKFHYMLAFELLNEVVDPEMADKWNRIAKRAIQAIRKYAKDIKIIVGGVCNNSVMKVKLLEKPYDENIVYNFHCYEPLLFTHQSAGWIEEMPPDFHIHYPESLESYRVACSSLSAEFNGWQEVEGISELGPGFFENIFREAIEKAEENNAMLYCGEYGVIDQADIEDTVRWFQDIHKIFDKYGIGHAVWSYREMDFGISGRHYEKAMSQFRV